MKNKMLDILKEITKLATAELGYLVDPQSSSPIDWVKYPVMFIDSVEEVGNDTLIVNKLDNSLDITVAIFIKDNDRQGRIKKVTEVLRDFKQFIYKHEQWGCVAVSSSYKASQTIWTTDTDNVGAGLLQFRVNYRESIPQAL
jgi:hypothetical protein